MKVSLIMITINREAMVRETLEKILNNTGHNDWELLVADNGSTDGVIEYIKSLKPAVHLLHGENKGVAYSLNRLIEKASGELICHIGNDIVMTDGWMGKMVEYQKAIPETGICAVHTVEKLHDLKEINGKQVHLGAKVFGPKMYRKELVKNLAYKEWSKYGLEDSDLAMRFYYQGLYNYYVPGLKGTHLGHDIEDKGEYRQMKWEELKKADLFYNESIKQYQQNDKSSY